MLTLLDRLAELFTSLVFALPVLGPQAHMTIAGFSHGRPCVCRPSALTYWTSSPALRPEGFAFFFFKLLLFFIRFIPMGGCFASIYVCTPCVCLVPKEVRRGQESLELQLLMAVRCCLGAEATNTCNSWPIFLPPVWALKTFMCMSVWHACCPQRLEEGILPLGTGVMGECESPCGTKPGSSVGQQVLSATKPVLQPLRS